MSECDRLIKLLDGADLFLRNRANAEPAPLNEYDIENLNDIAKVCDEAARALEKAIIPPCKVGDKVYVVDYTRLGNMIFECEIEEISHFSYGTYYYLNWGLHIPRFKACQEDSFGKKVFLTKEEAEQALSKLQASYEKVTRKVVWRNERMCKCRNYFCKL